MCRYFQKTIFNKVYNKNAKLILLIEKCGNYFYFILIFIHTFNNNNNNFYIIVASLNVAACSFIVA